MGKGRKKLQAKIDATATGLAGLKAEIATLEKQKSELQGEVAVTKKLRLEENRLQKSDQSVKSLLKEKLLQYQALKEATDEFAQWCANAHGQSEVMVVLGVDEDSMQRSIERLIQNLNYLTLSELGVDMLLSWNSMNAVDAVTSKSIPTQQLALPRSHIPSQNPWALLTYLLFLFLLLMSFTLSPEEDKQDGI